MKLELHFRRTLIVLAAVVTVLPAGGFEAQAESGQTLALTFWQTALSSFQKAGLSIAEKKYPQAKAELSSCATNLPEPYNRMANQFRTQLDTVLKQPAADESTRLDGLVELCTKLRAFEAISKLKASAPKSSSPEDETEEPLLAWRLFETGRTNAAVVEYERKLADELTSAFQVYYQKQISLIKQRPGNLTNVQFAIEFVREHYLKGYEDKGDSFGALKELTRVLPYAHDRKDALDVYHLIIQCLTGLGDFIGRDAWEDKTLSDFKSDAEACAEVYLNRGIRVFLQKDFQEALAYFRKVCVEYSDTIAYGDAQYNIGSLFQQQKSYDEAIEEYAKLFSSNVNDYRLTPGTADDYRNYRHKAAIRISECYEAKKKYTEALAYAEMARTQYRPLSWCGTCLNTAKDSLERRIKQLVELANKPK